MSLNEELVEYARVGNLKGVKKTLEAGADVHALDDLALRPACQNGYVEIVKLLLEAGANVNAGDGSALCLASGNGHVGVVEALLVYGANVHADIDSALRLASDRGHINVVIKLVEAGADLWVLRERWFRLFGYEVPDCLVEMSVEKVIELMVTEAVGRELI